MCVLATLILRVIYGQSFSEMWAYSRNSFGGYDVLASILAATMSATLWAGFGLGLARRLANHRIRVIVGCIGLWFVTAWVVEVFERLVNSALYGLRHGM